VIRTHQLTRRFGRRTAVDRVDLSVEGPGVVGLLGLNGAGKTTLMRMLTGYLAMTEGTAEVAGIDVFDEPMRARERVGYLPERPPLDPELTVGEFLRFVARIRGVERRRRVDAVGRWMERLGLGERENQRIDTLSKGFRQRVGLAQACLHDPPVLILDEPTSGLDPAQLVPLRRLVAELGADRLVLLSTHVLSEVDAMCRHVVVLHQGRIAGQGTAGELAEAAGVRPWVELVVRSTGDHRATLAAVDGVGAVERRDDGSYRVEGDDIEPALARVAAPWGIERMVRHDGTLSEAFLSLVGAA